MSDTSPMAKAVQRAAFAAMSPADRMVAAMRMADEVKQVTLDGIRLRNPQFDEAAVHRAWFEMLHGVELTELLLGPAALP